MNIVGIDPSLISTGMCVNGKLFSYVQEKTATTKKGALNKWFKLAEPYITYHLFTYKESSVYAESEMLKLQNYNAVTDKIVLDLLNNIDPTQPTAIGIEGYSFSSTSGNALIDLVTFSTLLRIKLFKNVSENITVYAPAALKSEAAKATYVPKMEGSVKKPKPVYYNHEGVKGGNFTKREMYLAICDNENMNSGYRDFLIEMKSDVMHMSMVPKPLEDVNDSKILYHCIKNKNI